MTGLFVHNESAFHESLKMIYDIFHTTFKPNIKQDHVYIHSPDPTEPELLLPKLVNKYRVKSIYPFIAFRITGSAALSSV